jgi:dephospho-CoA kinase
MKLLIIGNARHGKDTFAELLQEYYGLTFMSSSKAAADIFLYDLLKDKYGYKNSEECFNDRINHREEWYLEICNYNKENRSRLANDILRITDCYVGMRDKSEFDECKHRELFDLIIWVDASERLPLESNASFNIKKSEADIIIENNTSLDDLKEKARRLGSILFKKNEIS